MSPDSHWPATEIWSVSEERPSLRSISKLLKSEGKFMANSIPNIYSKRSRVAKTKRSYLVRVWEA